MDFLKDFVGVLNLDSTFFVQFAVVVVFYFVTTRLFINSYLSRQEQRQSLTKGRMVRSEELEKEKAVLKEQYAQKAREVHQKFQEIFQQIRQTALEEHRNQVEALEREEGEQLKKDRETLIRRRKAAEEEFQKDRPLFVKSLVEKLGGNS